MSSREVERLARLVAGMQAQIDGMARTQQVSRTVVDGVPVEDRLAQAADSAERVTAQGDDIARLDDGSAFAAWDAAQQVPVSDGYVEDLSARAEEAADAVARTDEWRADVEDTALSDAVDTDGLRADAEQAGRDVAEALDAAAGAAQDAAAATETALGFARYSQIDGGEIYPPLPDDGPRVGAELVHVAGDGHPYRVDVWNGAAWVKNQLLLDQMLVLGPDGTVQIENGRIVSPVIIGAEITGARVVGGEIAISDVEADSTVTWSDNCEVASAWQVYLGRDQVGPGDIDASRKRSGAGSLRVAPSVPGGLRVVSSTRLTSPVGVDIISLWVYAEIASGIHVYAYPFTGFEPQWFDAPAGVWTKIVIEPATSSSDHNIVYLDFEVPHGYAAVWVDDIVCEYFEPTPDSGVRIFRAGVSRRATVESTSGGNRVRMSGGGLEFATNNVHQGGITSSLTGIKIGYPGLVAQNQTAVDAVSKFTTTGNVFALRSQLEAWSTAPDGTHAWVTSEGREYVRAGGAWIVSVARESLLLTPRSPFSNYGSDSCLVERDGRTVQLAGILAINNSSNLVAGNQFFTASLPAWARPERVVYEICQGSGSSRWLLSILTSGVVRGERYDPSATSNNLWLPFHTTYLAAS